MVLRDALKLALGFQETGDLDAAESVYGQVLAQQPANPDALHYSGVLADQRGRTRAGTGTR